MMLTAASADAAFVDAVTASADTGNDFGQGQGEDQSNVRPCTESDDTLLAFAPVADAASAVAFDKHKAPANADPPTVRDAVNDVLGLNEKLVSFSDRDAPGRLDVPDAHAHLGDLGGCAANAGTFCKFRIEKDFSYDVARYGTIYSLFEDGGDNIAHFDLGDGNYETSKLTFNTPLPAAAWMMLGGLGTIGGAVARTRRTARADA